MDLFLRSSLDFEKVSSETTLPEDPNAWPKEILQELYKQVPYIADFQPHIEMDRVDGEKGYGMGHVEVMNQTEIQQGTPTDQMAAAGVRVIRIPIIIKNNKLYPFDILVTDNSKIIPLTESRLRQAIFRPQAFDVTSKTPGDQSMIGQLYPPYRQNYGFGGGGVALNVGMGKESASTTIQNRYKRLLARRGEEEVKSASLLTAIIPTINQSDYLAFSSALEDRNLQLAFVKNANASAVAIEKLVSHDPSMTKSASPTDFIKPTVIQVSRVDDGYKVKTASHVFWAPKEEILDRGEVVRRYGAKIVLAADLSGAATVAEGATASERGESVTIPGPVGKAGLYKVQDNQGRELLGTVIPHLFDTDGTQIPLALFTNGSQSAVQDDIVGIPAGEATDLPSGEPGGKGAFYTVQDGEILSTIPLDLQSSYSMPGEAGVHAGTTFDGRPVEVSVQPNIQVVVGTEEGRMLVPAHWKWMPLDKAESVSLASAEGSNKQASAKRMFAAVEVRCGGMDSFSLSGPVISKLASDETQFLSLDDTMFLLAGLGVEQNYGIKKLGEAFSNREPVLIKIGRSLKTAEEQKRASIARAAEVMQTYVSLRRPLFKEAAVIPDPTAVDTILSLGFINPENLLTFISYLPVIDDSQSKLCELLLAARLGLRDIPVSALEKSIRATEEIIEGLKVLAFQEN